MGYVIRSLVVEDGKARLLSIAFRETGGCLGG